MGKPRVPWWVRAMLAVPMVAVGVAFPTTFDPSTLEEWVTFLIGAEFVVVAAMYVLWIPPVPQLMGAYAEVRGFDRDDDRGSASSGALWLAFGCAALLVGVPMVGAVVYEGPFLMLGGFDVAPVLMGLGVAVLVGAMVADSGGEDRGSSAVVGSVLLVGFVAIAASGLLLLEEPEQLPTGADVSFRAVDPPPYGESLAGVEAVEVEVNAVRGADVAQARLVVGNGSVPWMIEKGSRATVGCPPPGVPVAVAIGDEVVAFYNALPCHVSERAGSSGDGDGDVGGQGWPEPSGECVDRVEAVVYAGEPTSVRDASATVGVVLCGGPNVLEEDV